MFTYKNIYDRNNISNFFLSPYCSYRIIDDVLYVRRNDTGSYLKIEKEVEKNYKILNELEKGMTEERIRERLNEIFTEDEAEYWLVNLIKGGIIE